MNERIIQTPLGNVLLYRELDNQQDKVIIQAWAPDESMVTKTTLEVSSSELAKQAIQEYTYEGAIKFIQFLVSPFS